MFTAAGKSAAASAANYIEEVFSTYLYTGNGSTQTITNGIDLSGKGGLVWLKKRSSATGGSHRLMDTVRGGNKLLSSNTTGAESTSNQVTFLSSGFDVIDAVDNGATYASWTFRKQAKFFDVVTYTGNGVSGRQISHNLGSTPGCIIVKKTDGATTWAVYHRGLSGNEYLNLNNTDAVWAIGSGATVFGNGTSLVAPTSSAFTVGTSVQVNGSGGAYIAYLFAHDAGGFGATGTDNVISCGSFVPSSGAATVTLGYEPQFVILRNSTASENWIILDTMRGWVVTSGGERVLNPNLSDAESSGNLGNPTATGFVTANLGAGTYIYIAIRRGPMKTPTSGTSVFGVQTTSSVGQLTSLLAPDTTISRLTGSANVDWNSAFFDRLRGNGVYLVTSAVVAEQTSSTVLLFNSSQYADQQISNSAMAWYALKRAPGFFDVVCYTGTGSGVTQTVSHNLTVAPEMIIVMARSAASDRVVWQSSFSILNRLRLNTTQAVDVNNTQHFGGTLPTSSVFYVGSTNNDPGTTYVAYLFATLAGITKVGSYTGTGALQTINCGFAAGARFILIKRTDSTGDWWVYDSARGITSGNDPYFFFNTTAADVTNTNYVDTASTGFQVTAAAPAGLNANGGTYLFLAIA